MRLYPMLLFVHILVVLVVITLSAVLHTAQHLMRRAATVEELRRLAKPGDAGPAFGVLMFALVGTGSWLVSQSKQPDAFRFATPFVWTGLVATALILATGLGVLRPHQRQLQMRIKATTEGQIPDQLRAFALSTKTRTASGLLLGLMVGIVFNMVNKPNATECLTTLAISGPIGAIINLRTSRAPNK